MLEPGTFLFDIERTIGEGGLGIVRAIRVIASNCDLPVGAARATKELNDKWRHQPDGVSRFEREIRAVKQMSHPQIIAYVGENLPGGAKRFYVMPLYQQSLRDVLLARPAGFPWSNVAGFGVAIADAMSYAHARGFIHRDLKPENVLLDDRNLPVVADWGLGYFVHKASKVLTKLTRAGLGTEYYCALEQWNTGKCGPTGDIYSLGLVLAELIRGTPVPIWAVGMGINEDVVADGSYGGAQMNALLREMTHVLPARRVQTMDEVAARLRYVAMRSAA